MIRRGNAGLAGALIPASEARTEVLLIRAPHGLSPGLLAAWHAQRSPGERWALAVSPDVIAGLDAGLVAPHPDRAWIGLAAGCACCVAASALSMALLQAFRRGPWHRLMIVLGQQARAQAVADALREGPLAPMLGSIDLIELDQAGHLRRVAEAIDGEARDASPAGSAELLPADWPALLARLAATRDPTRWRWVMARGQVAGSIQRLADDPLVVLADASLDAQAAAAWIWPASRVFDRVRIDAALRAMADEFAGGVWRAVLRTRRDWYEWRTEHGRWACSPALTRGESRIECRVDLPMTLDPAKALAVWRAAYEPR